MGVFLSTPYMPNLPHPFWQKIIKTRAHTHTNTQIHTNQVSVPSKPELCIPSPPIITKKMQRYKPLHVQQLDYSSKLFCIYND